MRAHEFADQGAAGIVLYAEDTGRYGLQQRSQTVGDPGVWAAWGGGREPGESLEQCARRELAEEGGYTGPIELQRLGENSRYVTFLGRVPHEFAPRADSEWQDYCWVKAGDWPSPMHPGIAAALLNISMNDIEEARSNPDKNLKRWAGKLDLTAFAENIRDKGNWGVSMTVEPKLGINPRVGISEDTPKGIYFYPLEYFIHMVSRYASLPWGDNMPYMQLFQYDRSGQMTRQTQVDPAQLRQALSQYCPEEVIQQVINEPDSLYDGPPYWTIYDALSRLGKSDETNIVRWNKVLRDLGFTSVFDSGAGWIATGEPTQGIILDPRIIKQHKMFVNRNPMILHRKYDINRLADAINWSDYYNSESQRQQVRYGNPDRQKTMLAVANTMLRPFLGKTKEEAKEMGLDQALKAAADKVIEILKQSAVQENFADGKNPGRKGLAKRSGVNTKASVSSLRKTAKNSSGEKQRMAHWLANMKAGRAKAKRK